MRILKLTSSSHSPVASFRLSGLCLFWLNQTCMTYSVHVEMVSNCSYMDGNNYRINRIIQCFEMVFHVGPLIWILTWSGVYWTGCKLVRDGCQGQGGPLLKMKCRHVQYSGGKEGESWTVIQADPVPSHRTDLQAVHHCHSCRRTITAQDHYSIILVLREHSPQFSSPYL